METLRGELRKTPPVKRPPNTLIDTDQATADDRLVERLPFERSFDQEKRVVDAVTVDRGKLEEPARIDVLEPEAIISEGRLCEIDNSESFRRRRISEGE